MSTETKKKFKLPEWATYVLVGLEMALMVFLVIIAFLAMKQADIGGGTGLIKWLIMNPIYFFMFVVFPLIVLFLFNIYLLIRLMNETSMKGFQAKSSEELLELARQQAREELMRELAKQKDQETATPKE